MPGQGHYLDHYQEQAHIKIKSKSKLDVFNKLHYGDTLPLGSNLKAP